LRQELYEEEGNLQVLVTTFWRLPLIFAAMIVVRGFCIAAFNPLFRLARAGTSSVLPQGLFWGAHADEWQQGRLRACSQGACMVRQGAWV
jgi:hypothetical protein